MDKFLAELKLSDEESDRKLTRTLSFSGQPSTQRVLIEQSYELENSPGLVRQYSYEKIFDKSSKISKVKISEAIKFGNNKDKTICQTAVPCFTSFKPIAWSPYNTRTAEKIQKPLVDKIEYMEIDDVDCNKYNMLTPKSSKTDQTNKHSENIVEVSPTNLQENIPNLTKTLQNNSKKEIVAPMTKLDFEEVKKSLRPLVPSTKKQTKLINTSFFFNKTTFFLLLSILVFIISAFISLAKNSNKDFCDHKLNFLNASIELQQNVYGQTNTITALVDYLEKDEHCVRIIVLLGGTGVGKSYTVEIIKRNFSKQQAIFQYFSPPEDNRYIRALSKIHCNLLIVENLRMPDIPDIITISEELIKAKRCVTLLAIFNIEKMPKGTDLTITLEKNIMFFRNSFENKNFIPKIFYYEPLNEEILEKCILKAMKDSNLKLNKDQINNVKQQLLISKSGCKGAYSKVQIVGREFTFDS